MSKQDQLEKIDALLRLLQLDHDNYHAMTESTRDNLAIVVRQDLTQFRQLCALVALNVSGLFDQVQPLPGPEKKLRDDIVCIFKLTPIELLQRNLFACQN